MILEFAKKLFGSANDRSVKKLSKEIIKINDLEANIQLLSDDDLRAKTDFFRAQLHSNKVTLDDIKFEAFAIVREAAKRVLGERPYDVQLIGGLVLHEGKIAEMKTGEGKTLVGALSTYLNALSGKGVHVVTVNDYLAKRDSEWMGQIYRFLGLSVGLIQSGMDDAAKQEAYGADITFATNNELGFDYLRDNMKYNQDHLVQRPFHYAIIDEVDSILIDEARTPLIISGPAEDSSEHYTIANKIIPLLKENHYEIDLKAKNVTLTDEGVEFIEERAHAMNLMKGKSLYDFENMRLLHHINQSLRAHKTFEKDVDYIIKDDQIMIIDEFTGRIMDGRRYSEGLHQAIEAKEGVKIQVENQTLASITFQNYFRLYPKLAGMTGTALTEAEELSTIYGLDVVAIPTHRHVARIDHDDEIYRSIEEKEEAIIRQIKECSDRKQPVLVGTVSIENSEKLSKLLKKNKIKHQVLNARFHEQEAEIITQAGRPGSVTIATNMAGRGTDIKLGGNLDAMFEQNLNSKMSDKAREKLYEELKSEVAAAKKTVLEAGGLYVLGTERHESRRIDNQLRGRSGRQGDPGASKFFVSLEDDLMRRFGSNAMDSMLEKLGWERGENISHKWLSRAIERAQRKVEAYHYDARKYLLKYDDVMNDQRRVIYDQRRELLSESSFDDMMQDFSEDVLDTLIGTHMPADQYAGAWNITGMSEECKRLFNVDLDIESLVKQDGVGIDEVRAEISTAHKQILLDKEKDIGKEHFQDLQKYLILRILDQQWKEHLLGLDHLRQGINLRAYAQKDPVNEYKQEAYMMFDSMITMFKEMSVSALSHVQLEHQLDEKALAKQRAHERQKMQFMHNSPNTTNHPDVKAMRVNKRPDIDPKNPPKGWVLNEVTGFWLDPKDPETWGKVPRNSPCPCGSGKKYKQCHGSF